MSWVYDEMAEGVEDMKDGRIIADVFGEPEEQLKRGRLIAAAPELLEALKTARTYVAAYAQNDAYADEQLAGIDAAIAKAEGRS